MSFLMTGMRWLIAECALLQGGKQPLARYYPSIAINIIATKLRIRMPK